MIRIHGLASARSRAGSRALPVARLGSTTERCAPPREIRQPEASVRADDPHQRDVRNIVTLGDHLCADQDIVFVVANLARMAS